MIVPLNLNQLQNNKHKNLHNIWLYVAVTTDNREAKMYFCFILFTAFFPPDKSHQPPGTHTCQLCQGHVLAENHGKTKESISPSVMAMEWGINLDLECWVFWVMAAFSQAPSATLSPGVIHTSMQQIMWKHCSLLFCQWWRMWFIFVEGNCFTLFFCLKT